MLHSPSTAFRERHARVVPAAAVAPTRPGRGEVATRWNHRTDALSRTSRPLALVSVLVAALVAWTMGSVVPTRLLAGWFGLVIAINWAILRARQRAPGDSGRLGASVWAAPEALVHALVWLAVPCLWFFAAAPAQQLLIGAAFATMLGGAFLLAPVPVAAELWAFVFAAALGWAALSAVDDLHVRGPVLVLIAGFLGAVSAGICAIARLLDYSLGEATRERGLRQKTAELLRHYEEQGTGWLWEVDADNALIHVALRLGDLLGRGTHQLIGRSLPQLIGDPQLAVALLARTGFAGIEVLVGPESARRWVSFTGNPVTDADGRFAGYRGVGTDITETRVSQERLQRMASLDVLTGLPNRQRMRELFESAVGEASAGRLAAILYLDLDGFKPVNDTFGHSLGDAVLRGVAQRLNEAVGNRGQVGRVGGDEFAVVLPDCGSRQAVETLGEALIARVAEPFPFEAVEVRIGLSAGAAFAPIDGTSVDELLVKADLALYEAKARGRGRFYHFDPRMQRDAEERVKLEHDLRLAVRRDELELFYQPIVSATTQAVVGFEALLRWRHPTRGLVPPLSFIGIAEETGMIAEIGEWVIGQACRDASTWPEALSVSVNLSARQLVFPALPDAVSEALARTRLQPSRLELEVTESVFLSDSDGSLDVLRRVRSLGVGIALDDFGTGYSSLGYLNKTIFHTLKIDASFVRDAAKKPDTVAIIRAIVTLATSFRMLVTAEGVETLEDFERMRDLGVDKIQGYLFGKPMPYPDTLKVVGETAALRKAG